MPTLRALTRGCPWADDSGLHIRPGWVEIVTDMVAEIDAVAAHLGTVFVRFADAGDGTWPLGLATLVMEPAPPPERFVTVVALATMRAGIRSATTCDLCGEAGEVQPLDDGTLCVRCAPHAYIVGAPVADPVVEPDRLEPAVKPDPDPPKTSRSDEGSCFRLYDLAHVRAALDVGPGGSRPSHEDDEVFTGDPIEAPDTEQSGQLRRILARGAEGCWRRVAHPSQDAIDNVAALKGQAPHMAEFIELGHRFLQGQLATDQPATLPPILLLGPPGTGKSWVCRRLAGCLGVPFRSYPMNVSSLSEGLTGNNGTWRNAQPGLVARTLLQERLANPVLFIDEMDKASAHTWNADPYRPFYTLLEPEGAREMTDEYLKFPMDASSVSYLMTANGLDGVPLPILDRLTVIAVPDMDAAQRRIVVSSIFADLNAAAAFFFEPPGDDVLDLLAASHPRRVRSRLLDALMQAAASGRRQVETRDVRAERVGRRRIGF